MKDLDVEELEVLQSVTESKLGSRSRRREREKSAASLVMTPNQQLSLRSDQIRTKPILWTRSRLNASLLMTPNQQLLLRLRSDQD